MRVQASPLAVVQYSVFLCTLGAAKETADAESGMSVAEQLAADILCYLAHNEVCLGGLRWGCAHGYGD